MILIMLYTIIMYGNMLLLTLSSFIHIAGRTNPSDRLTKYLGWSRSWPLVQPILFGPGGTMGPCDATKPLKFVAMEFVDIPVSGLRKSE
jgi:hypothetical protein